MSTISHSRLPIFDIGNAAEKIINELTCSVLAFKPEGFVSPITPENHAP